MNFEKYTRAMAGRQDGHRQKGSSNGVFYLQGIRNVGEIVDYVEDIPSLPSRRGPQTSGKSILGSLLNDARKGHKDFTSPQNLEKNRQQKAKYGSSRAHSIKAPTLPSLRALQHLTSALQAGSAFKGDSYRPKYNSYEPHHAPKTYPHEKDQVDSPVMHVSSAYHVKSTPSLKNIRTYCQVSLCPHEHLCIDWDVSDPGNAKGSWIASLRRYWDHASSREDHKKCESPDSLARCKILAQRIMEQFVKTEQRKLTDMDRRNGIATRRPPSFTTVEREVRLMYSHTFRGKTDKIVEEKENVARKVQDRATSRKLLTEKLQTQARQERQGMRLTKDLSSDDIKNREPVKLSSKKRNRSDNEEAPKKRLKLSAPVKECVKPVMTEEHKTHATNIAARLIKVDAPKITQKPSKSAKSTQPGTILVEPNLKQGTSNIPVVSASNIMKPQKKQAEENKDIMTAAERKLLVDIQQAASEETEEYISKLVNAPIEKTELTLDNGHKDDFAVDSEPKQAMVVTPPHIESPQETPRHQNTPAQQPDMTLETTKSIHRSDTPSNDTEPAQSATASTSPLSSLPASPSRKRKYSSSDEEEGGDQTLRHDSACASKKVKVKYGGFSPDVVSLDGRDGLVTPLGDGDVEGEGVDEIAAMFEEEAEVDEIATMFEGEDEVDTAATSEDEVDTAATSEDDVDVNEMAVMIEEETEVDTAASSEDKIDIDEMAAMFNEDSEDDLNDLFDD